MEISSGLLEVMDIVDDKDVIELIKHAVAEEIIFKPDSTDDSETEIEEIIEIIEEVDESENLLPDYSKTGELVKGIKMSDNTDFEENLQNQQCDRNSGIEEAYISDEENVMFKLENDKVSKSSYNEQQKSNNKVITYDADEDWQDEDIEHLEEIDEVMNNESDSQNHHTESSQNYNFLHENERSGGNQGKNFPLQSHKTDIRNIIESTTKVDKSQPNKDYGNDTHNIKNIDNNFTHEVIKNTENNLIYTVLGSRKPTPVTKQLEEKKYTDAHYIKMEQLSENTIPVEGTIYYEGDNMETLYVAQAVDAHEQYQYEAVEQNEQTWDTANEDRNSENDVNQYQEEENSQDQIFLHEDEDGQLYFKDDHGELQPVYLTEDGNYAIADNSDDQDSKESHNQLQQNNRISEEASMTLTESKAIIPKNKQSTVSSSSTLQDLDNEDNTVTISLIISEDEHGQKRTQVIIPTTDNMKCDICNKSFKTSFQLLRHNRLKHAREEDITTRNFPCDLCPKSNKGQMKKSCLVISLTRHMVTTHMNPEKLRQQAEEQRRKRENNYRRYLENRKMYETQHSGGYGSKRNYHHNARILSGNNDEVA
ncbi:zinc finger protein 845-like isoform X2 [Vespula squamosa]|uniref:Zinc finger protein 845-like isoform X2 n=1 Tax=Vespula squamosa TaxID=30214 RepID=A0ABD2BRZ8_VESSQ